VHAVGISRQQIKTMINEATCSSRHNSYKQIITSEKLQPVLVAVQCSGLNHHSCSTSSPVSTEMGVCIRAGKLSHYVTSHPGQLSLPTSRVGKCSWEGKGRYGSFQLQINVMMRDRIFLAGKTMRSLENTFHT